MTLLEVTFSKDWMTSYNVIRDIIYRKSSKNMRMVIGSEATNDKKH